MLILLRHGRTVNNAQARLQGQFDSPLDEVGVVQARAAGDYIRSRWKVDEVVTSSLSRTVQTAHHAGFDPDDASIDDRWREIDFGEYDRRRIAEVIDELNRKWTDDAAYRPASGESLVQMHGRVSEACVDLAERAMDHNVLVVTHATPIKSAAVWALGGPASMILRMWVNLATVSVLDPGGGRFLVREFNTPIGPR